jgi:REP element-mobilizing transposase RayT
VWNCGVPHRNSRNRDRPLDDFHVYNRERNRDPMFIDDEDRRMFLSIVRRYLSVVVHKDARGRPYRCLRTHVRLLAFALMDNHFHLVLRQLRAGGMEVLMRSVMTSYVQYFNRRHDGGGSMFVERYRAAEKVDRRSKLNAIAYVHDNHSLDCRCEFCSHRFYMAPISETPSWIEAQTGVTMFGGVEKYLNYREHRSGLSILSR